MDSSAYFYRADTVFDDIHEWRRCKLQTLQQIQHGAEHLVPLLESVATSRKILEAFMQSIPMMKTPNCQIV